MRVYPCVHNGRPHNKALCTAKSNWKMTTVSILTNCQRCFKPYTWMCPGYWNARLVVSYSSSSCTLREADSLLIDCTLSQLLLHAKSGLELNLLELIPSTDSWCKADIYICMLTQTRPWSVELPGTVPKIRIQFVSCTYERKKKDLHTSVHMF